MRNALFLAFIPLSGCTGNAMSDYSRAAEKLNQAGLECSLDVRHFEFVESRHCVQFAALYWRYREAKETADNSTLSALMTAEFERIDNRALHGVIAYSWALTGQGFNDARAFQKYFDEDFVKELHLRSGKKFRQRKPLYKY